MIDGIALRILDRTQSGYKCRKVGVGICEDGNFHRVQLLVYSMLYMLEAKVRDLVHVAVARAIAYVELAADPPMW